LYASKLKNSRNSFFQFCNATLKIGPCGVKPFFAGLRAAIEPRIFFDEILKNLDLSRTKDDLGSQEIQIESGQNLRRTPPMASKGTQIQIQEEIEIASKPANTVFPP